MLRDPLSTKTMAKVVIGMLLLAASINAQPILYGCKLAGTNCNGNGFCEVNGYCTCNKGYWGENCENNANKTFYEGTMGKTFIAFWVFFWIILNFLIPWLICLMIAYLKNKSCSDNLDHINDCKKAICCCFFKEKPFTPVPAPESTPLVNMEPAPPLSPVNPQPGAAVLSPIVGIDNATPSAQTNPTVAQPQPQPNSARKNETGATTTTQSINAQKPLPSIPKAVRATVREGVPGILNKPAALNKPPAPEESVSSQDLQIESDTLYYDVLMKQLEAITSGGMTMSRNQSKNIKNTPIPNGITIKSAEDLAKEKDKLLQSSKQFNSTAKPEELFDPNVLFSHLAMKA